MTACCKALHVALHGAVVREETVVVREIVDLLKPLRLPRKAHALEYLADVFLLRRECQQLRKFAALGEELLPHLAAVFFHHPRRKMQMRQLLFEVHHPKILDSRVCFVVVARPIEVALGVFVHGHALEHIGRRIGKAPVTRYMLFLDHRDFRIQLSAQLRFVQVGDVQVIVHRLLLRRRDDADVQPRDRVV